MSGAEPAEPAKPVKQAMARGIALSLAVGAVGGGVFYYFRMPLAWMLGAMTATTAAALAGAPLAFWPPLRTVMIASIGTLLGGAFTPDIVDRLVLWPGGAALVVGFVGLITVATIAYYVYVARVARQTAFFAASPGGLSEMTLMGEAGGGDPRAISLSHATRIFMVVFTVPFYLRFVEGLPVSALSGVAPAGTVPPPTASVAEMGILVVSAVLGAWAAGRLRLPSAAFLGPFITSIFCYVAGLVEGRPPIELVWGAQLVIGSSLGARFVGIGLGEIRRVITLATGSAAIMLAGALLAAHLASPVLGVAAPALVLALAPGGLAEMALMALSLDIDTAFVSTMHMIRISLVMLLMPVAFHWLGWNTEESR